MDLTLVFEQGIKKDTLIQEILTIIRQNTEGRVYLTGGKVYRTIVSEREGLSHPICDYDILVEHFAENLVLPKGWQETETKYGNPKLLFESTSIDIVPLRCVHSILKRKLLPTKENYLSGTPFTIQSILYDLNERKVVGQLGIDAILTRTVRINNYDEALNRARMKGVSVIDLLKDKAESIGFTPVYI